MAYIQSINCKAVISSGYRTKARNKAVGGAKNSYHIHGKAYDIVFPGCRISLSKLGLQARLFFKGVIVYPNHIHVDIRKKPYYSKGAY